MIVPHPNFRYFRNGSRDICGRRAEILAVVRLDIDNVTLHVAGMDGDRQNSQPFPHQ